MTSPNALFWFLAQWVLLPLLALALPVLLGFWMWRAPQSLKEAISRLWDVLLAPVVGVQQLLASALQGLQGRITALAAEYRSPRVMMGALFCILAACCSVPGAGEFLFLTVLGILGIDAAPLLGNFAGHAICLSLFMGLAFTFALGLEFLGAAHLGLVDSLSPRARRWVGVATALLLGLAILGLILLGQSRSVLAEGMLVFSGSPSSISTPAAPSSAGDSKQAALTLSATMLLVPIFIELSAALALWGMFQHTALLFLIVMRLLSFALALLNLVPTILSVMGKGIRDVLLLVVDFIGSLRQDSAPVVVPSQTPTNDSPLDETFTLPAQPHQEPIPDTAVQEPPLMPETTPIDQPNLNPLGVVAPNHSEAGGTHR